MTDTYTVVYKLGSQYWLVRYVNHISQSLLDGAFEACIWGTEVARWGDD